MDFTYVTHKKPKRQGPPRKDPLNELPSYVREGIIRNNDTFRAMRAMDKFKHMTNKQLKQHMFSIYPLAHQDYQVLVIKREEITKSKKGKKSRRIKTIQTKVKLFDPLVADKTFQVRTQMGLDINSWTDVVTGALGGVRNPAALMRQLNLLEKGALLYNADLDKALRRIFKAYDQQSYQQIVEKPHVIEHDMY